MYINLSISSYMNLLSETRSSATTKLEIDLLCHKGVQKLRQNKRQFCLEKVHNISTAYHLSYVVFVFLLWVFDGTIIRS